MKYNIGDVIEWENVAPISQPFRESQGIIIETMNDNYYRVKMTKNHLIGEEIISNLKNTFLIKVKMNRNGAND